MLPGLTTFHFTVAKISCSAAEGKTLNIYTHLSVSLEAEHLKFKV